MNSQDDKIKNINKKTEEALLEDFISYVSPDLLESQKNQVRNKLLKQIFDLRESLVPHFIRLMYIETVVLFIIVVLSSLTKCKLIDINPTTLQILVSATIAQISAIVIFIIRSVFPTNLNKIIAEGKIDDDD